MSTMLIPPALTNTRIPHTSVSCPPPPLLPSRTQHHRHVPDFPPILGDQHPLSIPYTRRCLMDSVVCSGVPSLVWCKV